MKAKKSHHSAKKYLKQTEAISRFAAIASILFMMQTLLSLRLVNRSSYHLILVLLCVPMMVVPLVIKDGTVPARIICSVCLLLFSLPSLLFSYRAVILIDLLLMLFIAAWVIFAFLREKKIGTGAIMLLLEVTCLFLRLLVRSTYYSFIDNNFLTIWLIPLILGLAFSIFAVVKWLKDSGFWGKIGTVLIFWLLAAFFLGGVVAHLNYALDFGEPQVYTVVIEDKNIDHHRKGPDDYEFDFSMNGRVFTLEVPSSEYHAHEVGDSYEIELREGAFGEPFYISGSYSDR